MKTVKLYIIGILILAGAILLSYSVFRTDTKSFSPEDTVSFNKDGLELEVFYNRPFKRGRHIFGGLVPYDQVWRTGANEATTFTTNRDLLVDGSPLSAGKYTLWTIPMENSWKVIFNSQMYPWGITPENIPSRLAQYDVLTVELPVRKLKEPVQQFTIRFRKENDIIYMELAWDQTLIRIPIREKWEN